MEKLNKKTYGKPKLNEQKIELGVYGNYDLGGGGDAGRELPGAKGNLKRDWLSSS